MFIDGTNLPRAGNAVTRFDVRVTIRFVRVSTLESLSLVGPQQSPSDKSPIGLTMATSLAPRMLQHAVIYSSNRCFPGLWKIGLERYLRSVQPLRGGKASKATSTAGGTANSNPNCKRNAAADGPIIFECPRSYHRPSTSTGSSNGGSSKKLSGLDNTTSLYVHNFIRI